MKTDSFFNIESIRTYFGYEGFRHSELSDFNTAINQLENEMYCTFRSAGAILESIEAHKEAKIISNKLKALLEEASEFTPSDKQKLYLELIDYYESAGSGFKEHLKHKYLKAGKKQLPPPVRYWICKAIEASLKEFNSYEPFQIYMLEACQNYFGYEIKRKLLDLDLFEPNPELLTYFYLPNIPRAPQPDGAWARSLKQSMQKDINFDLVSTVILESQSERKYKSDCRKNNITYYPPRDIACLQRLTNKELELIDNDPNQKILFPITELELKDMLETALPLIRHKKLTPKLA